MKIKIDKKHLEFLSFLQKQMKIRYSDIEGEIGKDERCTTEYLILSLCWQEYLRIHFGLYPALDGELTGTGKNRKLWNYVEKKGD